MEHQATNGSYLRRPNGRYVMRLGALLGLSIVWGPCLAGNRVAACDSFLTKHITVNNSGRLNVIVGFQGRVGQAQLRLLSKQGADIYRHLDLIHSVAARVPARSLHILLCSPFVRSISSDEAVRKTDAFTVGSSYANVAWQTAGVSGSGIGVAVLDTGITNIADFGGYGPCRLVKSVVFSSENNDHDDCGHGTHVAGIIAGDGLSSTGSQYSQTFLGIAPRANLIGVKVLDHTGSGTVSQVIAGINWCLTNKTQYNIRVMNLSLGHPVGESYTTDPLCQAVEAAWKGGIVVVCAAGNEGRLNSLATTGAPNGGYGTNYASVESPGNDPYVITVGAMKSVDGNRAHDQIATYSGRGPSRLDFVLKPDVVAPGNRVISTDDSGSSFLVSSYASQVQVPARVYWPNQSGYSNKYFVLSGTSMATPVVSGAAALMFQQHPNLSPDTVKARLMVSADKWTDPYGNGDACSYGAGYVDIPAALTCSIVPQGYALSPTVTEDSWGNVNVDPSFLSGQRALWGTGLPSLGSIFGNRALWGNNTLSSSRALWGNGFWTANSTWTISSQSMGLSSSNVILQGEN